MRGISSPFLKCITTAGGAKASVGTWYLYNKIEWNCGEALKGCRGAGVGWGSVCPVLLCLVESPVPVLWVPQCAGILCAPQPHCANHTLGKALLCAHSSEILQDGLFYPVFLWLFAHVWGGLKTVQVLPAATIITVTGLKIEFLR